MTTQSQVLTWGERAAALEPEYEHQETRDLVALVTDAAELLRTKGEEAFNTFRTGERWRREETYVFVLDPDGTMLVHPDPTLQGKNVLSLKDVSGKPIIRGLIDAATALPDRPEGWYHYQWPVPGGLLPRWKSSYVRLVRTPSGKRCIVGSGMYNDRMERAFVMDAVTRAVGEVEQRGEAAFRLFHDPSGPFLAKDAYIFVLDMDGRELVNPAFPNFEGRVVLDLADAHGKQMNREMLDLVRSRGSGWVDYMWPKPGESVSTRKSAFVSRASVGTRQYAVGCGVYLADAPRDTEREPKMTAPDLMRLVREAAALLAAQGEQAYPEMRRAGTKWRSDSTYFFVLAMDGTRVFHGADPTEEGKNVSELIDVLGRSIGRRCFEAGNSATGEGWVHYMYPKPGGHFPVWKSTFVKAVTFPSGEKHIVGSGVYNMKMDRVFIEDVVGRAAALVAERGRDAFPLLRDRTGSFVFMDTYVFVQSPDGTELVNAAHPALEGRNLMELKDLEGKAVVREEIAAALKFGSAWIDCYWYRPGDNQPARKETFVRKVEHRQETFIVGSGIYLE